MGHQVERRFVSQATAPVSVETREDGSQVLTGYGAVFHREGDEGTEYRLWSDCVERIAPGAFNRAIEEGHDARGLFNHNPDNLLGRVGAKTMRLSVDATGLRYEIDVPDTQAGRDVVTSIERGDLTGSSFAFVPKRVTWIEEDDDAPDVRMIDDLDLYDTGPVTYPAYQSTTTGVRSEGDHDRTEYEAFKKRMQSRQAVVDSLE